MTSKKKTTINLHGMTAEEANFKLDESLPHWVNFAICGSYQFITHVDIICGGGSQVLSEVVENWIKQNDKVSNAQKRR
jgi:DNA-nicking Smr family endonuclease